MSYELQSLKTLRVAREPAGSYGVAIADGSFVYVPITEGFEGFSPGREMLDPGISTGTIDGSALKIPARKTVALKVDAILGSHGLDLDGDVAVPSHDTIAMGIMLRTVLGYAHTMPAQSSQVTVQAGSTTTSIIVSTGAGARWQTGLPIGLMVGGRYVCSEVVGVSGDTLTLRQALTAAPTTGSAVRVGLTYAPSSNPDSALQFLASGAELDDHFRVLGCQGGMSLEAKIGQIAKIGLDLKGQTWTDEPAHAGLTEATFASYAPVRAAGGCVTVPAYGSSTRVEPLVSDFAMSFALAYEPISSYCATDTIAAMRRTRAQGGRLAKGSFTIPFEDSTWIDARDAQALRSIYFQIGDVVGATVLVAFPHVQIVGVSRAASGPLAGQTIEWEAMPDTLSLAAPFRIHLM